MNRFLIERLADVLTGYCTDVRAEETVAISGGVAAQPLLEHIYRKVVDIGANPVVLPTLGETSAYLLANGSDKQLAYVSPIEHFVSEQADVLIRVRAEENTRRDTGVDPARAAAYSIARSDLGRTLMERGSKSEVRWTGTIFPTNAYAQDANMSTDAYTDFVIRACKLDEPDPAEAWRNVREEQARLISRLTPKVSLRIVGPGTDLTVGIGGRTWINSDGKRNFPSGEVFTGPIEDSAEGQILCSFPVITAGRELSGVRLQFEQGVVVDASAEKNEDYLLAMLDSDDGARKLGEVAIGTNFGIDRFNGQILLDEKIGGTAHVALGRGYPESGSTNQSAIHWDLICDLREGGRIEADGELIMVDGHIVS